MHTGIVNFCARVRRSRSRRVPSFLPSIDRPPLWYPSGSGRRINFVYFESSQLKGGKAHFSRTSSSKNQTSQPQHTPVIRLLSCVSDVSGHSHAYDSKSTAQTVLRKRRVYISRVGENYRRLPALKQLEDHELVPLFLHSRS